MPSATLINIAKKYLGRTPAEFGLTNRDELAKQMAEEIENLVLKLVAHGDLIELKIFRHQIDMITGSLRFTATDCSETGVKCLRLGAKANANSLQNRSVELNELASIIENRIE